MSDKTQNHQIADLFQAACHSGNMDAPRLINLLYHLMATEFVPGAVCEFGCHKGKTAVVLAAATKRPIWVYDSFRGLPAKSTHDITEPKFVEGYFKTTRAECEQTFREAGLTELPIIVEGLFEKIQETQLPRHISFCHIDADLHDSTMTALELVYPRLVKGGICFIDDYNYTGLPGVKIAVDTFLKKTPERAWLQHPMTLGYRGHQCWFVKV